MNTSVVSWVEKTGCDHLKGTPGKKCFGIMLESAGDYPRYSSLTVITRVEGDILAIQVDWPDDFMTVDTTDFPGEAIERGRRGVDTEDNLNQYSGQYDQCLAEALKSLNK